MTQSNRQQVTAKLAVGGRIVIPVEHRRALGIEIGDEVIVRLADGELRIMTRAEAIKRAQAKVTKHTSKKQRSLVDELSLERQAEAGND